MTWFRKAADQGVPKAQYSLGMMYEQGRGVERSDAEAMYWYQKAADGGLGMAREEMERLKKKGV